jgi:hypothetical protein
MVVCAVMYEPVSKLQFPANREFAGNFGDSGFPVPIPTLFPASKSDTSSEIPYATEQGIFDTKEGILLASMIDEGSTDELAQRPVRC